VEAEQGLVHYSKAQIILRENEHITTLTYYTTSKEEQEVLTNQ